MKFAVLCPHFAPDTAPTGEVMTRIVHELAELGHTIDVVTSLPWYREHRIEVGWAGKLVRREETTWGSITRVHPFPGTDKRNLLRRALGFAGFSVLAGLSSLRGGRVDGVIAMSPPLTLGLTGWVTHLVRRGPLVFNLQDIFPDAAVQTGAITNRSVIAVAHWIERLSYRRAAAVTVLSEDLRGNVVAKLRGRHAAPEKHHVHVIPNFVDTDAIRPQDRLTAYRRQLLIQNEPTVMYAGNVGFSQSLELLVGAARAMPDVMFVVNGDGAARAGLEDEARGLANVRFAGYQPRERLSEVLASADLHVVPLKTGLGNVSVPSKTYSILAAGRPILASIDAGTEVPRILAASGAGRVVPPDDQERFTAALAEMLSDPDELQQSGRAGRRWVEESASPRVVAEAYVDLVRRLRGGGGRPRKPALPR
jgi:colanic acid biosynthesis glycosyl transferase WcaI